MTGRLDAALAELAAAIRDEVRAEMAVRISGPPELLSIESAARQLGIGRTATYDAIGRGELRSLKVGRRRLIPADALGELIATQQRGRPVAPGRPTADDFESTAVRKPGDTADVRSDPPPVRVPRPRRAA